MDALSSAGVEAVSPIINMLIGKAASCLGGDVTRKEMEKLRTKILPTIQSVIEAAEAVPADRLKPWLAVLRAATIEAEDVLDLYEYETIKNKISTRPQCVKNFKAKSKEIFACVLPKTALKNCIEKLQGSADEAKELLDLIRKDPTAAASRDAKSQHSTTAATVSGLSSPVFGRDEERNSLIDMLISSTSNITQHALCGVGGAGKTTLAQYVYNEERVTGHFDTRMWVHVSRNFDVRRVTIEIIESASQGRDKCSDISNLNTLQLKLEELLKSKRFLLVLDDIWCEDRGEWDKLLIPLNMSGKMGSRILITTRMEGVALQLGVQSKNIRSLKDLRREDCWSILKHYAFGDANKAIEDKDLAATGEEIVDKLKNSPLAARLVGSLLGRNVDVGAWKMILKKGVLGGTLDNLLLSFRHLPLHLQSCFAFCSLYPKGYRFSKDKLARLWVAEGFLEASTEDGLTAVEKGQQYFDELLSCSFFQSDPSKWYPGSFIIHDLLHDLAEEVSKGHCFRIEGEPPANIPPTVVHLSVVGGLPMSSLDTLELVNLRTFMEVSSNQNTITEGMLEMLAKHRTLRVIHLQSYIDKLSSSMGKLKHLRYLEVPGVKELPESLGKLYHLQFLILKYHDIERAPKRLNNLVNLQYLISDREKGIRVTEIGRLTSLQTLNGREKGIRVPEIGRLTSLQTLNSYYVERIKGYGIEQLQNLQQLRGSLEIEGLENVKSKTEAMEASLNQKKYLEELGLVWESETNTDDRVHEEVLEGLEPPSNLRRLKIIGYQGANAPCYPASLEELCIRRCDGLASLPANLEGLPSLRELQISECPKMGSLPGLPASLEEMDIGGCDGLASLPANLEGLPSLRTLGIHVCPKMGSLPSLPTSLEELGIRGCDGLTSLPANLEGLPSFRELLIGGCPKMGPLPGLPASLEVLEIGGCDGLASLPANLEGLPSLRRLRIHRCPKMGSLPSLPTSLEELSIGGCDGLASLPANLEGLPSLRTLRIDGCPKMGSLPGLPTSLVWLEIHRCDSLASLPANLEGLSSRVELRIGGCPKMGSLPGLPTSLVLLSIDGCDGLASLPANLEGIPSLRTLGIHGCPKMGSLPGLPASLEELRIRGCDGLASLPANLGGLPSLRELRIGGFPKMGPLPGLPASLEELEIDGCDGLASLPANLEGLASLRTLRIGGCPKMGPMPGLPAFLEGLEIDGCDGLASLPANLEGLPSLRLLRIGGCPKMGSLPGLPASLIVLEIDGCDGLASQPANLEGLASLRTLRIRRCPKMGSLPGLPASLEGLEIVGCDGLASLPANLEGLASLRTLRIDGCPKMGSMPGLPASLGGLEIDGCDGLASLPANLEGLPSLRLLRIGGCPKLGSLPSLPTSLKTLDISNCSSQLKKKYSERGPLRHKINHIPKITIDG